MEDFEKRWFLLLIGLVILGCFVGGWINPNSIILFWILTVVVMVGYSCYLYITGKFGVSAGFVTLLLYIVGSALFSAILYFVGMIITALIVTA